MLFILQRKELKKKRPTDTSSRSFPLIYIFLINILRHFLKNSPVVDRLEIQNWQALQLGRFKVKNIGKLKTDFKAKLRTTSGFMLQQFLWNKFGKHIVVSIKNQWYPKFEPTLNIIFLWKKWMSCLNFLCVRNNYLSSVKFIFFVYCYM